MQSCTSKCSLLLRNQFSRMTFPILNAQGEDKTDTYLLHMPMAPADTTISPHQHQRVQETSLSGNYELSDPHHHMKNIFVVVVVAVVVDAVDVVDSVVVGVSLS